MSPDPEPSTSTLVSLRTTSEEHHARLLPHVDRLLRSSPRWSGTSTARRSTPLFEEEYAFVVGQLVPHMETIERALYGRLEELHGRPPLDGARCARSTRRCAQLVEELGRYRGHVDDCSWSAVEGMALRRALYRLHALLKVHLAEEELYLGVLDAHLTDAEKDRLARSLDHAMAEPL